MRKVRLVGTALVFGALALGGIVAAQDEEVTIVLQGHSSSPAEDETLQAQVDLFMEAYPNITVDVQLVPEYDTVLQTAFASGDYPNVFYVGQDRVDEYADAGVLASAEGMIDDQEGLFPSLVAAYTYDGTFYCPAKDFSNLALQYNTDLFDQAGVEYPTADWTWEDLRAAAETITAETGVPALAVAPDIDRWLAFYVQAGGQLYDADGAFVFASEGANYDAAISAAEFFNGLYQDGLARTPQDLSAGWSGEAFGSGAAAMTMEGNWIIQYLIDTYPDLNWGVTELPSGSGDAGVEGTLTFSECFAVGADNEYPEESFLLVNFLTGEEGALRLAEGGFGPMPTRTSASDAWLENRGEEYEAFVAGGEYAIAPALPPGFADFRDELGNGLVQLFAGSTEPADAIGNAVEVAEEIQAENE